MWRSGHGSLPAADFARSKFPDRISITCEAGNVRKLDAIESEMIRLGIGRSTLYRKVRDLSLEVREG